MRIIITGSTSFLGSGLTPMLEGKGHEVFRVARSKTGAAGEIEWDLARPLAADLPECDALVHLAAYPYFGQDYIPEQYYVNTLATAKLAEHCRNTGAYMLFTSMAGLHPSDGLINAGSPVRPGNHYAMSKLLAEEIIRRELKDASILRIGGIYGLGGPSHLGLNTAITRALREGEVPTMQGPGNGRRNYISVDDTARWIADILEANAEKRNGRVETLYVAGSENLSIEEYLSAIVEEFLPGREIDRKPGNPMSDVLVEPDAAPFELTRFRDYLVGLKRERNTD